MNGRFWCTQGARCPRTCARGAHSLAAAAHVHRRCTFLSLAPVNSARPGRYPRSRTVLTTFPVNPGGSTEFRTVSVHGASAALAQARLYGSRTCVSLAGRTSGSGTCLRDLSLPAAVALSLFLGLGGGADHAGNVLVLCSAGSSFSSSSSALFCGHRAHTAAAFCRLAALAGRSGGGSSCEQIAFETCVPAALLLRRHTGRTTATPRLL